MMAAHWTLSTRHLCEHEHKWFAKMTCHYEQQQLKTTQPPLKVNPEYANVISNPHHPLPEDMALLKPLSVNLNKHAVFFNAIQVFWQQLRITNKFCVTDRQMR
jgi:hypothetical protein